MSIRERWKGFSELPPDIERALEGLPDLLANEDVLLAYVFGSLARGKEGNDVDLAILTKEKPVFLLRAPIVRRLDTERVDLVDLRLAPPVLRFEILRTGRCLYAADESVREQFELQTLRVYRDTRPLRSRQRALLRERMAR